MPRIARYLLCFALVFGMLSGLLGSSVALAAQKDGNGSLSVPPSQEEEPPAEEPEDKTELRIASKYPVLIGVPGFIFQFPIELEYRNFEEDAEFELIVTPPSNWDAVAMGGTIYDPAERIEIETITLGSGSALERITVLLAPSPGHIPEPGEYILTLEANSDVVNNSIDLTAVITTSYRLNLSTATGQLTTEVEAGKDRYISVAVVNSGWTTLENITFSVDKPEGWSVTFAPAEIDSLGSMLSQEVGVIITPSKEAKAGDYDIIIKAESEHASDDLTLRAIFPTFPVWQGVSIGLAATVVASLVVFFGRFGRRW